MKRPTPSIAISIAALVVALGGTSYAAAGQIRTKDIAYHAVTAPKINQNAVDSAKIKNNSIQTKDLAPDAQNQGPRGPAGVDGQSMSRWALVETNNTTNTTTIAAQSGGFTLVAGYPTLPNTATAPADNSLRANGNVYINSGEDLGNNGVIATIALQNTSDLDGDGVTSGRAPGADSNPEFSGEISSSLCNFPGATGSPTNCAPAGAQNSTSFVVSPRNSDGSFTKDGNRKRFFVMLSGDSSDYTSPAERSKR